MIVGQKFPELPSTRLHLVTDGIGRLQPGSLELDTPVIVNEPIILAALVQWVNEDPGRNPFWSHIAKGFDQKNSSVKGFGFEDIIIYLLWQSFSRPGTRLSDVFSFQYLVPSWADETAQLLSAMSAFNDTSSPVFATTAFTTPLSFDAQSQQGSVAWFEQQDQHRAPFLKPDNYHGPDAVFGVRLQSGNELLIVVQCKCWQSDKHGPKEVEEAVYKLSPEGFYLNKNVRASFKFLPLCCLFLHLQHSPDPILNKLAKLQPFTLPMATRRPRREAGYVSTAAFMREKR